MLVTRAKPFQLRRPPLRQVCLDVGPSSKMFGSVYGRRCTIVLDSDCSENFIFISQVEEVGLLTGEEGSETINVHMHIGKKMKVTLLDEVVVTLGGQVEVRSPFSVLSKSLEGHCRYEEVLLGLPVLRRGSAMQTSGKGRSRLYK